MNESVEGDGQRRCGESDQRTFRKLLPAGVAVVEGEVHSVRAALFPSEAAFVRHAVEGRRTEFSAGRELARRALAGVGAPHLALAADRDGVPAWPPGFIGCITHGGGRVAAAAAPRSDVEGLGIDMEAVARLHRRLEHHLFSPSEIRLHLAGREDGERQVRSAVLFCAKEAWFKCQFPLSRRRLGLLDAEVEVDWHSGEFAVLPRGGGDYAGVRGCTSVHAGMARAAIVLEAGALSAAARSAWQLPALR